MRSISRFLVFIPFVIALILTSVAMRTGATGGKDLFVTAKCNNCHSITKLGIAATRTGNVVDLSTTGKNRTAAFLGKYLLKTEVINAKKHKVKYQGTPAQLTELSTWLATLK